jgi:hypothetical protein
MAVKAMRLLLAHWTGNSRLDKQIARQELPHPKKR